MSYPPPYMQPTMMGGPLPPLNTPPPNFRPPGSATIGSLPQLYANPAPLPVKVEPPEPQGPLITVFVGNISERIPDTMMKKVLATCGTIVNWKRVSTFGFCEFDGPIAGARAVRLLNDLEVDGKQLVAKVDAKNKALLDQYQEETNQNATQATKDANAEEEKKDDKSAADIIGEIIEEYSDEIMNAPKQPNNIDTMHKPHKTLSNSNVPDEKRDIINQEIGKFRKYTEEQEQRREKEKDRKRKEDEKRERRHESPSKKEKKSRHRTPDEEESPRKEKKSRRRSEEREREERERMEREREERERQRERERQMERERREREEMPKATKNAKEIQREKEMEEESRDRKKQEKKAREKEAAYQERLKNWEGREKRRAKEYEKEKDKERLKDEEREKEAKRLKEFLEDYEDERDDQRFYKGRELQRRLADRVREADSDAKDRAREQEELEELKSKIFGGEYDNPTQEFEKQKKQREEQYKPKLFLHNDEVRVRDRRPPPVIQNEIPIDVEPIDSDDDDVEISHPSPANHVSDRVSARDSESRDYPQQDEDSRHSANTPSSPASRGTPTQPPTFQVTLNLNAKAKIKKVEVKDVFPNDDDQEESNGPKKRKLVPLVYDDPEPKPSPEIKSSSSAKTKSKDVNNSTGGTGGGGGGGGADGKKPDDEKRRHIKSIIDKIPTEKNALFNYPLDKSEIDGTIEKKIRPWINKKIIEYIGEPEPTLVDFICSKVLAGSTPQGILDDVQMVLDEEAEVFVVKMWRLLIYEVEAKKRNF